MKTSRFKNISKYLFILAIFLVLGLALRLFIIFQPAERLVQYNGDDMYYYLKIGENIINGNGVSFDGIHPTNGFHPLYLLLILPILKLFLWDRLLTAQLCLVLLAVFNIATSIFIYKIIEKIIAGKHSKLFALLGAFIWLFNPWTIYIAMLGVEVAISAFFISLSLYFYIKWRNNLKFWNLLLIGVACGLAFLARSDSVFVAIAIGLDMIYSIMYQLFLSNRKKQFNFKIFFKTALKYFLIFGLSFCIIISPWLMWSKLNFGMFTQGSGMALLYSARANLGMMQIIQKTIFSIAYSTFKLLNFFIVVPFLLWVLGIILGFSVWKNNKKNERKIQNKKKITTYFLMIISLIMLLISSLLNEAVHYPQGIQIVIIQFILGFVLLILGFLMGKQIHNYLKNNLNINMLFNKNWINNNLVFILCFIFIFGFYSLIFFHHQPWYFMSILLLITIITISLLANILDRLKKIIKEKTIKKIILISFLILILIFSIRFVRIHQQAVCPWQADMYSGAVYLNENLGKDEKAGAFNTGIFSYYSGKTVVNLDGVVNYDIVDERKKGTTLSEYLIKNKIEYVIDYPCFLNELKNNSEFIEIYKIPVARDAFCENSGPVIYQRNSSENGFP